MAMPSPMQDADFDALPLDQIDVSDPILYETDTWYRPFARLRAEDPVHHCADSRYGPYWSITRYADIMAIELDHNTYSSERGGIQVIDAPDDYALANFIRMDPPKHTTQRKTVAPVVGPKNLKNLEATIRERTNYVLDSLPRGEAFNWVDLVSIELTTMMLATLFDFPWEDRRKLTYWSDVAIANIDAPDALVRSYEERHEILLEMGQYFADLWNQRVNAEPRADLISMLAHGESTRDMDRREFIGNIGLLIVGGNDTTRNSMTSSLMAFDAFPAEYAKLKADRGLLDKAVSEMIRWATPVIHMRRTVTRDVAFQDKTFRTGDKVVMWYVSGNWDEAAIEQPDRFIVDRPKARQHLSFGAGIHRCVGDRLAEVQLRILWEEVLNRGLKIELLGPAERVYSNFLRGFKALPVRIAA